MLRITLYFGAACVFSVGGAFAQSAPEPSYTGTWRLQSDNSVKWILDQHDDTIRLQEVDGTGTIADETCNTLGKECEIKESGRHTKVTFWFNGPKLVELETRGDTVLKRRFDITNNGSALEVEQISIVPPGKTGKLVFAREK